MRTLLLPILAGILALTVLFTAPAGPAVAQDHSDSSDLDPTSGEDRARAVLRAADIPEHDWLPGHRGVDLALAPGQPVLAAGDGVVAFAGVVAGMPVVSIDHPDGIRTTYQPVHRLVDAGQPVSAGEVIGRLGAHPAGEAGLHWGARTGPETYMNPLRLLATPTIRLKPLST